MTTAQSIIADAYVIIGQNQPGDNPSASQGSQGLNCLNQILGQWSLMPLTIPVTAREVFPLEAGRGGPSDPYTIGPGGDFDTGRPTFISNVGLLVTSVDEPFEISRSIYTNDAYASIVQKELTSNYFTGLYYNATFSDGRGTIYLWPVPANDNTSLVLYRPEQLSTFTTINTAFDFPPGALPALTYELGKWLSLRGAGSWSPQLEQLCNASLAVYQRGNTVMSDLGLDAALTTQSGVYNSLSDSISGFRGR